MRSTNKGLVALPTHMPLPRNSRDIEVQPEHRELIPDWSIGRGWTRRKQLPGVAIQVLLIVGWQVRNTARLQLWHEPLHIRAHQIFCCGNLSHSFAVIQPLKPQLHTLN